MVRSYASPMNIADMTPEQREHVAYHMERPLRCGGRDIREDGVIGYRVGGKFLTEAEFKALSAPPPCPICLAAKPVD